MGHGLDLSSKLMRLTSVPYPKIFVGTVNKSEVRTFLEHEGSRVKENMQFRPWDDHTRQLLIQIFDLERLADGEYFAVSEYFDGRTPKTRQVKFVVQDHNVVKAEEITLSD